MPRRSNTLIVSEPVVLLSRWRIFETDDGLKRLVGFDNLDQGCVSSALVKFDQDAMQAQTSDGSTYRLLGEPGFFWTVVEVWDRVIEENRASGRCVWNRVRERSDGNYRSNKAWSCLVFSAVAT